MARATSTERILRQVSTSGGSALRVAGVGAGSPIYSQITIGGTAPQLDDTDKVAVSLYGKASAAGDKELLLDSSGHVQADILTIAAGNNNIGNVDIVTVSGQTLQLDDTDKMAVSLYGQRTAAGDTAVGIDPIVRAIPTITVLHYEIHESNAYHLSHNFLNVSDGASAGVIFNSGASHAHALWVTGAGANAQAYLTEDPTVSGGSYGTALTIYNKDRGSANTTAGCAYYAPVLSAQGTIIDQHIIPGSTGPKAIGATGGGRDEWILAPNTEYVVRVVMDGGAGDVSIQMTYYEE